MYLTLHVLIACVPVHVQMAGRQRCWDSSEGGWAARLLLDARLLLERAEGRVQDRIG